MTRLYFEEAEVGTTNKAGPYLVSKEEIIQFAKQYDAMPSHIDEKAAAHSILGGLTASAAETIILEKRESKSKPDRGVVRIQIQLRNQRSEIVLQCINNLLVARRPDAKASA
jgi:acyl dehydratase